MKVEPFGYPLENKLIPKLDLMIERCIQKNPKRDAVLIIEGAEGEGKTTFSIAIGYYVAWKTGRTFNHTKIFFDLNEMIDFLKNTDEQIVVWDEPALQALSRDSLTRLVKDLERLLMMARKKRHFIMINLAYFNKFSEYIVWQRPLGMIHVYSRRELSPGRFVYIRKKNLEHLWYDWRSKRKRNYKKWCSKSVRGNFPDVLNSSYANNVLSHFDFDYYDKKKDEAIRKIGEQSREYQKDMTLRYRMMLAKLIKKINSEYNEQVKLITKEIGLPTRTYYDWRRELEKQPIPKEN